MPENLKLLQQRLDFHTMDNTKQFNKIESSLTSLKNDMRVVKENHLSHLEAKMEKVVTDVSWLKKFFWIIATASIGGFLSGIINLLQ